MSFLDQALNLLPLAAIKPLSAEQRNIATFPAGPPSSQRFGALVHSDAGPPGGGGPPQRLLAVLGPGATFAGLADTLLPLYAMATIAGAPANLTRDELAQAIVVYAKDYLQADNDWQSHLVGVLLPLPIEVDPGSKAWVLDAGRIRDLALSFDAGWRSRLSTPPGALGVPDALDLEASAGSMIMDAPAAMLVQQLLTEAMRNPSQQVLRFLAVLRVMDGKGAGPGVPGQAGTAVLAALTGTTPDQLSVLAATTAGNALLRCFAELLSIAPPGADPTLLAQARTNLADALRPGGVPVVHQDVPEAASQLISRKGTDKAAEGAATDPPGGVHRLVLGRDVAVGRFAAERVNGTLYTGPSFAGQLALHSYLTADAAILNPGSNPDLPALLVLLGGRPIAATPTGDRPTGWRLDAVQARGPELLTAGLDRWGVTDSTALPALLLAYKNAAPDEFGLFFGVHNLDVRLGPAGGPAQLLITGPDGTGSVPDDATLRTFFGGIAAAQDSVTFGSDWAARFRLPALVSAAYRRAQVAQAAAQLAASTDKLTLTVASVTPFPATTYPAAGVTSDDLSKKLTDGMNSVVTGAPILGARDGDTLAAAVVDLTGAAPAYAGFRDDDTFYAASLAKILPMYAAFELRSRVQQVMTKTKAAGLTADPRTVCHVIGTVWGPQVCRVLPDFPGLDYRFPDRFPDLRAMFTVAADGTVGFRKGTVTDAAFGAAKGAPGTGTLFADWMKGMILWSDPAAAGMTITAIQYPYINGLLRAAGFYQPIAQQGLWISGNYAGQDWAQGADLITLSDRGQRHYKQKTNFVGNAREIARLLALAATGLLFAGDTATRMALSDEMILLMQKDWVATPGPPPVLDGPVIPGGPGTDTFFGSAIGLVHGDTVSSKIGIGDPQPGTGLVGIHDCAIIGRTVSGSPLHYVAVVLGGFNHGVDGGMWVFAARAADAAMHP